MAKDLSSARRGRRHVTRDYTSKLRSDINVREADRRAKMATAGMIGDFASGVANYAETLKTNKAGWDKLQAGGEELHKKGIEAGTIAEGTKFDLATSLGGDYAKEGINKWDMWTSQAPVTKQMKIGKDKFYGINVAQVGVLGESAGLLVDKKSDKSLYDYLKIGGDKSTATKPSVESTPSVQNMITENNTITNNNQSFTSAPNPVASIGELETMKKARPIEISSPVIEKKVSNTASHGGFGSSGKIAQTIQYETDSQNVPTNEVTQPSLSDWTTVSNTAESIISTPEKTSKTETWYGSSGAKDMTNALDNLFSKTNYKKDRVGDIQWNFLEDQ